jgi:oxygen-independent coproporphyrinogen-3 oxidase
VSALDLSNGSPYVAYLYSYPHKTAYRPLSPAIPLDRVWGEEKIDALSLYVHVPFCEMRCGFCNLFTTANPQDDLRGAYLDQLERQAERVRAAIPEARFSRFAIGGGTPTYLEAGALVRVLDVAEKTMGADIRSIPTSVETSPETATRDRLHLLESRGVDRISIGVQTFFEDEAHAIGRPQKTAKVDAALDAIKSAGFSTLNIDLMYGLEGQTTARWIESIRRALRYRPEELYLYPIYVRPLTGLGRSKRRWDDLRLERYREGRALLLGEGFTQVSMRMFRAPWAVEKAGPVYCCQADGMIGLGVGARSYTRTLHYASEYAVSAPGVKDIIRRWVDRDPRSFDQVDYGMVLDGEDERRRFIILSLLADGLDLDAYRERFSSNAFDDVDTLAALEPTGLAIKDGSRLVLTERGVERADGIGPLLASNKVRERMEGYVLR